jgi:hypothetical protein
MIRLAARYALVLGAAGVVGCVAAAAMLVGWWRERGAS